MKRAGLSGAGISSIEAVLARAVSRKLELAIAAEFGSLERDDGHTEGPSLPRLVEHELAVRARKRRRFGQRTVDFREAHAFIELLQVGPGNRVGPGLPATRDRQAKQ